MQSTGLTWPTGAVEVDDETRELSGLRGVGATRGRAFRPVAGLPATNKAFITANIGSSVFVCLDPSRRQ